MKKKQIYRDWRKRIPPYVNTEVDYLEYVKIGSQFYVARCTSDGQVVQYKPTDAITNEMIAKGRHKQNSLTEIPSTWQIKAKEWAQSKKTLNLQATGDKDLYKQSARGYDVENISEKRIYRMVDTVISKIAEDLTGYDIYGDEFWDIDRLMNRRLNKYPLSTCKNSREREKLIFIVDTSPSCYEQAKFYSKLAMAAAERADVDIYDAPNSHVEKIYDGQIKKWKNCWIDGYRTVTDDKGFNIDFENNNWSERWKGRTIIFFGDWDGCENIGDGSHKNKVYFFCSTKEYAYTKMDLSRYIRRYKFRGKHYICNSVTDFINLLRKVR
jgi:hypothetical protein